MTPRLAALGESHPQYQLNQLVALRARAARISYTFQEDLLWFQLISGSSRTQPLKFGSRRCANP